jgi:hypothetical protein
LPLPTADKLLNDLDSAISKSFCDKSKLIESLEKVKATKISDPVFKNDGYHNASRKFTSWETHPTKEDVIF